jgi:hypothetical protein
MHPPLSAAARALVQVVLSGTNGGLFELMYPQQLNYI